MIIALIFWLASLFGDGSVRPFSLPIEQAAERVKSHVVDADRLAKALAVLERMDQAEHGWTKACEPHLNRLQALSDSRTSAPAEFERLLVEFQTEAAAVRAQLLELRFELKGLMTAEEWAVVFPMPAAPK